MLKTLLAATAMTFIAGAAYACPNIGFSGPTINASATQLYSAQNYNVTAGGSSDVSRCGIRTYNGVSPTGWVAQSPDFELNYYKDANYSLELRVVSNCDSVLLINDGDGDWFFDDDSNGNSANDALLRINNPASGTYDIWIGTFGPQTCTAQLQIETY